jgi:hypothetical protein
MLMRNASLFPEAVSMDEQEFAVRLPARLTAWLCPGSIKEPCEQFPF